MVEIFTYPFTSLKIKVNIFTKCSTNLINNNRLNLCKNSKVLKTVLKIFNSGIFTMK